MKPELPRCPACGVDRAWHGSFSAKKAEEAISPWTRHIYLCRCPAVSILVVYADGRREMISGGRHLSDFLD